MSFIRILTVLALNLPLMLGNSQSDTYAAEKISFSQEILAYNTEGSPLPAMQIDVGKIQDMKRYFFPLGEYKSLVVETNIADPQDRGLPKLANIVKRCYQFIEDRTGIKVKRDILIYLVELDYLPRYYRFNASFSGEKIQWGEVRLALIPRGAPLIGPEAPLGLAELLYDTIPHELGHDILAGISSLPHDLDNSPSHHTRWFIEGVCELLAKQFIFQEAPERLPYFLAKRNVGSVLDEPFSPALLFQWSQHNDNSLSLESDLYGTAMLVLMQLTESVPLDTLLAELNRQSTPCDGQNLILLTERLSGLQISHTLSKAYFLGKRLGETDIKKQAVSQRNVQAIAGNSS